VKYKIVVTLIPIVALVVSFEYNTIYHYFDKLFSDSEVTEAAPTSQPTEQPQLLNKSEHTLPLEVNALSERAKQKFSTFENNNPPHEIDAIRERGRVNKMFDTITPGERIGREFSEKRKAFLNQIEPAPMPSAPEENNNEEEESEEEEEEM